MYEVFAIGLGSNWFWVDLGQLGLQFLTAAPPSIPPSHHAPKVVGASPYQAAIRPGGVAIPTEALMVECYADWRDGVCRRFSPSRFHARNRRSPVSRVYGASSCVTSEVGAFLGHRRKHTQKANYEAAADEGASFVGSVWLASRACKPSTQPCRASGGTHRWCIHKAMNSVFHIEHGRLYYGVVVRHTGRLIIFPPATTSSSASVNLRGPDAAGSFARFGMGSPSDRLGQLMRRASFESSRRLSPPRPKHDGQRIG
jgi:hypothetical protein